MVLPSFLALTITPSMVLSSAEETWPLSVSARAMVGRPACKRNAAALTLVSSQRFLDRILFSQELLLLSGRTAESNASPGQIAPGVSGLRPGAASGNSALWPSRFGARHP